MRTSLPSCPRCGCIIAGTHVCTMPLFVTPGAAPTRDDGKSFYERLYLEKWAELDEMKGQLSAMTAKRDKLKARAKRLQDALERISDESPHIENPSGVCPACMADVVLGRSTS